MQPSGSRPISTARSSLRTRNVSRHRSPARRTKCTSSKPRRGSWTTSPSAAKPRPPNSWRQRQRTLRARRRGAPPGRAGSSTRPRGAGNLPGPAVRRQPCCSASSSSTAPMRSSAIRRWRLFLRGPLKPACLRPWHQRRNRFLRCRRRRSRSRRCHRSSKPVRRSRDSRARRALMKDRAVGGTSARHRNWPMQNVRAMPASR